MPTFGRLPRFAADWKRLELADRDRFRRSARDFRDDLSGAQGFRKGLRVKRVQGAPGEVWEMTFAPNVRATWQYGPEIRPGEPHVIWRRIGTHDIFGNP
ncbi:MAG: hypothetical protein ACRDP8_16200 [Actinopolymorphaceae bacterium]